MLYDFEMDGDHFLQPHVDANVLENYILLEEKIAVAEKQSPRMLLAQKQAQIQQLTVRIEEQNLLVEKLQANV